MTELSDVLSLPQATCFACGAKRNGVVAACPTCHRRPETLDQLRQAIASSGYDAAAPIMQETSDSRLANPVYRAVKQRSVEHSLNDRQLLELLDLTPTRDAKPATVKPKAVLAGSSNGLGAEPRRWLASTLDGNPFYVLRASSSDPVDALPTQAVANTLDGKTYTVTSACLLDSAKRLLVEVHWLGDVSVDQARGLIEDAAPPEALCALGYLNWLHLRLLQSEPVDAADVAQRVRDMDAAFAAIETQSLLADFNASRRRAGVVEITDEAEVERALSRRLDGIVSTLVSYLDGLTTDALLTAYTNFCPDNAQTPAKIAQTLVSHYWRFAGPVLLAEGDKVIALCRRGAANLHSGDDVAAGFVTRLASLLALHRRLSRPLLCSPQRLAELRTSRRLMREAIADLLDAAESGASEEFANGIARLQHTYFDGD